MKVKRFTGSTIVALGAFTLSSGLHAQTLNTIYSFGRNVLGYQPGSGVVLGPSGNLYGATARGGVAGYGSIYELTPPIPPSNTWSERVLHSFNTQGGDGAPSAGLLMGTSGVLYGVTGPNTTGADGTAFQLNPPAPAGTQWRETVLHAFTDSNGDGGLPKAAPVFGPEKVLYGTASIGGSISQGGAVYQLVSPNTAGEAWDEQIIYSFPAYSGDGFCPGAVTPDGNGGLYGVTECNDMVYHLAPPVTGNGNWTETVLHIFAGEPTGDWGSPNGVVIGANGVLYGTAMGPSGSASCPTGCGTVFQLSPPTTPEGSWTETIIHAFAGTAVGDGSQPNCTPVLGPGGVLYGTTFAGGATNHGSIFAMYPPSAPGDVWTEVVLYSFTGGADGWEPNAVALGADGNLYGTTAIGGVSNDGVRNQGTVFELVLPQPSVILLD